MIREASKIINCILEFCRENQEIIMYAGLALLGIVILIAIICAFSNRKDSSTINIQEPLVKVTIEDAQKAPEPAGKVCGEDSSSKDCVHESKPSSRTDCIESIVEYLQSISPELLKEVEIRVHDAEIRIRYSKMCSNDKAHENVKNEEPQKPEKIQDPEEVQKPEEIQETVEVQEPVENQESEIITEDAIENVTEDATENVIEDATEGVTVRIKFGPDNINISRSGRVFSEEELEEQIRD